jgi:hypothetical protein
MPAPGRYRPSRFRCERAVVLELIVELVALLLAGNAGDVLAIAQDRLDGLLIRAVVNGADHLAATDVGAVDIVGALGVRFVGLPIGEQGRVLFAAGIKCSGDLDRRARDDLAVDVGVSPQMYPEFWSMKM